MEWYDSLSKEVSYALRHAPWEYDLQMDEEGWVLVGQLVAALRKREKWAHISESDLQQMLDLSIKKRFEMRGGRIRAFYGHSIPMKIEKEAAVPPDILYHGTARRFLATIRAQGLVPGERQYVHLSQDVETAENVGKRHDARPAILVIDARQAWEDGVEFYHGNEKVWLAEHVPARYIRELPDESGQQKKKVKEYSLGMKQRLGFAAALLGKPKLLLLDEPTNGLDPAGIQEMRELIERLPEEYGITVMVSSHLLSEIDQMATDVGIIDKGKMIYQGALQKLHDKARSTISMYVLNQAAAVQILERYGESYAIKGGELVFGEREELQVARLVALLANGGAQITRVSAKQKSLEDIFLQLTGKQVSL